MSLVQTLVWLCTPSIFFTMKTSSLKLKFPYVTLGGTWKTQLRQDKLRFPC